MHRITLICLGLFVLGLPAFADEPGKPAQDPKAAFAETDKNADGRIDRQEFHERVVEIFFHGDRDKDGYLTNEELVAVVVFPEDFDGADVDDDGRISLYEFIDVRFATFDEVDDDGDGLLTVEEVTEAYEARD